MTTPKTYTLIPNHHWSHTKNHKLVRAAYKRGLTGIVLTKRANIFKKVGWYLKTDQLADFFIGFNQAEAEARINRIEKIETVL